MLHAKHFFDVLEQEIKIACSQIVEVGSVWTFSCGSYSCTSLFLGWCSFIQDFSHPSVCSCMFVEFVHLSMYRVSVLLGIDRVRLLFLQNNFDVGKDSLRNFLLRAMSNCNYRRMPTFWYPGIFVGIIMVHQNLIAYNYLIQSLWSKIGTFIVQI